MKNRRIAIVAFVLCAAMVIGLGYAAVTNTLDIQGSVAVDANEAEKEFNEDIYFVGVKLGSDFVANIDASAGLDYTANINTNNNNRNTNINSNGNVNGNIIACAGNPRAHLWPLPQCAYD